MNNFAVLTIAYTPILNSISISISTNNPCHLTCYYTEKAPGRHQTSRTDRGLTLPWGAYYCFVAWQSVEQVEPEDTLIHTFDIPTWSICQTLWFTFRGTVSGSLSPSVSCLFKKHHRRLTDFVLLRPNAPGDQCFITYQAGLPCPAHYANLADIVPDEHVTTVYAGSRPGYVLDFYNIQDPPSLVALIKQIIIVARFRANITPQYPPAHIILTIGGKYYTENHQFDWGITNPWNTDAFDVTTDWAYYQSTWPLNPATGAPWTWQNITDLQIGIALRCPRLTSPTIGKRTYCTQVYTTIQYETLVN